MSSDGRPSPQASKPAGEPIPELEKAAALTRRHEESNRSDNEWHGALSVAGIPACRAPAFSILHFASLLSKTRSN